MNITDWISDLISDSETFIEKILDPAPKTAQPKEALVKVRLIDLLPPELPGWPSKYPPKH
jgi:hypothetical protein